MDRAYFSLLLPRLLADGYDIRTRARTPRPQGRSQDDELRTSARLARRANERWVENRPSRTHRTGVTNKNPMARISTESTA